MKIKPLLEELALKTKNRIDNSEMPVYACPLTKYELADLVKDDSRVRFIADSERRKVWVFTSDLLHTDVDKALKVNKYYEQNPKYPAIYGQADYSSWHFHFTESFNLSILLGDTKKFKNQLGVIAKTDWSFMTKYISDFEDELDKVKKAVTKGK